MKKSIFFIALTIGAMACNNNGKEDNSSENPATEQKAETRSLTPGLYGKEWILLELNGKAVLLDTTFPKQPHLIFEKENRISGNLGCNSFGGNLELQPDNGIKISEIAATQMACPNLEIEQTFLEVLKSAKSFAVESNTLTLSNDKKETIAKFQAQ